MDTYQLVDERNTEWISVDQEDREIPVYDVVFESDDPLAIYDRLEELGDEAVHHAIHGLDVTELPDAEVGEHRAKKKPAKKK